MSGAEKIFVTGYILAGGKSSRMGTDKGLLMLNGKAIVQHVIDQIQPTVDKVIIVSDNPHYQKFGLDMIGDLIKDIGPAGGIYSALSHTNSNQIFAVSCDMPFINSAAVRFMIEAAKKSQITLPQHKNKIEPLFGVYSKQCLLQWEKMIRQGTIKLQSLVSQFELLKVNVEKNELFNNLFFSNINTKIDFENAIQEI